MSRTSPKKILICGLPGSGKTTLANILALKLSAVHFNGDELRQNLSRDLGFSIRDRIEQARRMGWLADCVIKAGHFVICDFVCPTEETRAAFNSDFIVWVNRINKSRFEDTNILFTPPTFFDAVIVDQMSPIEEAEYVLSKMKEKYS